MKFIERIALTIFSLIISILSIALILIMLDIIEVSVISKTVALILTHDVAVKVTFAVAIVSLVLALKCIFFGAEPENNGKDGVVLENSSGKLVISKESLENLIANVVKDVAGIEAISSKTILDKNNNLVVYVTTLVSKDIMIKDVSAQIQEKIKEALTKTADLEVKAVNVKVKNITNKRIKGLPAGDVASPVTEETQVEITNQDNE